MADNNDALINLTNPVETESQFRIPPLTMRSILLLEKINSPFTRQRPVKLNSITGEIVLDPETQEPQYEDVVPTTEEIAQAFFVLINQQRPDILAQIKNAETFEQSVLEFASKLGFSELREIASAINTEMERLNVAAADMNQDAGQAKN